MPNPISDLMLTMPDVTLQNITFTQSQWLAFAAQVNAQMSTALTYGLIIGAIAGAGGLYIGLWYRGRLAK